MNDQSKDYGDLLTARRMQRLAVRGLLSPDQVDWCTHAIGRLSSSGDMHAVGWLYDALRRNRRRMRRGLVSGEFDYAAYQRALDAEAHSTRKMAEYCGQPLVMSRAPSENTIKSFQIKNAERKRRIVPGVAAKEEPGG